MRTSRASPSLKLFFVATSTIWLALVANQAEVNAQGLEGIGYREQALQQAKTSFFRSEEPNGIMYASFGGGTNIFVKSDSLNENPEANMVWFRSHEFDNIEVPGRPLDQDDSFNSNPLLGFITYRLPAPHEIFGSDAASVDKFDVLNFYLSVKAPDIFGEMQHLKCSSESKCRIRYHRTYTPVVYYISPQVLFYESYTQIFFDPKGTLGTVRNLESDEIAFVNTEIGGSKLDFEYLVDYQTWYGGWRDNSVQGRVGEMPIGYADKDIKMLWEVGYASVSDVEATTCTYDMKRCYKAMTVPVIFNISAHSGNVNGMQNLTVYGHGFNSPNVSVKVAGVDCKVTSYFEDSVSCQVQPASAPTVANASYAGSHGVRNEFYNNSGLTWNNYHLKGVYEETVLTQFEVPTNLAERIGYKLKGWFVAPATTRYRFHIVCDDHCFFKMGLNTSDPLSLTTLVETYSWKNPRRFFTQNGDKVSDWVDLVKGEKYYIDGKHYEGVGGDNYAVGVEIEQSEIPNHLNQIREVQYLEAYIKDPKRETTRITVTGVSKGGSFYLNFQDPIKLEYQVSKEIQVGASASSFRSQTRDYYVRKWGADIAVNLTMYMANGSNTTNATLADTYVYHVMVRKLISQQSVSNIQVVKKTQAVVTIDLPNAVQLSSTPLSGRLRVTCPGPLNNDIAVNPFLSTELVLNEDPYTMSRKIYQNCTMGRDKLEIWRAGKYPYQNNGVSYYIRFIGMNGTIPQMRFVSGDSSPIQGDVVFNQTKIVNASSNLFYPAIPFEMLRTYETNPQVEVSVGEFPAVCKNLSCDFNYVEAVGEVTAFSFSDRTNELQLTGTALPVNASMIEYIEFAQSRCTISQASNTSVTCTLDQAPVCGQHLPTLVGIDGKVTNSARLAPQTITCTVDSVVPTSQLNLLGGDNLAFSGTYFPHDLAKSPVEITFNDIQATKCVPQTSSSTSLVCLTQAFDKSASSGQTLSISITINGQRVTNTLQFNMKTAISSGLSLSPTSTNPTLKTKVNITLQADFAYTLDKTHFSANVTNISNPTYFRQMNVIAVDDATKTITCMFGGAWSGLYKVDLRHKDYGLIDTTGLVFTVGSNVTSYSPMQGSIYGGTLLTITGTNFGKEITDNPVQISTLGAVGSVDCFLQSITETHIVCRLDKTNQPDGKKGKMIVFLKTSEETTCVPNATCDWTYIGTVPTVTAINPVWDERNGQWTIEVDGTGFTGSSSTTELNVNGRVQTTLSMSSTKAIFKVSNITGWELTNMKLYFDVGFPAGHDTVIEGKNISLSPKLVSLTPNVGSAGGTIIIAKFEGLGEIANSSQGGDLVDVSTGQSICQTFKVKSYGVAECLTKSMNITKSTVIGAKRLITNQISPCNNSDVCGYEQLDTARFPVVTSLTNRDAINVVFTGTNFFTSGYTAFASFAGIEASTVTIDSATSVSAAWSLGLPPTGTAHVPLLWFKEDATGNIFYAKHNETLTKTLSVASSSRGLQCSFAGGCNLEINADGLSNILKNDSKNNFVSVCDDRCEFVENLSDGTKAVCKLPKVSTVYSNQNYKIELESEDLRFRKIFGNPRGIEKSFDSKLTNSPSQSSQSYCSIGGSFKEGHVGMLSQVKYFMGNIQNKGYFADVLVFQGSDDNSTWSDLFTVDDNIHEGWNYHNWETADEKPKHRFYRFHNPTYRKGCIINEIKMTGVETINDQNSQVDCTVKVQQNDVNLATLANTVTYTSTLTTKLDSVNPRFGPVTGGTSVTFTGVNFQEDIRKYTIVIDGRTCPVDSATTTSVTCTTDHRPGLIEPSLQIFIEGYGYVANQQNLFRYVSMWSDDTTWGGEFAPMHMESVYVPKGLNLYVDVDKTPELNLVLVEGSIIFGSHSDPNHERFFDARYIFVHDGYMEVGTEEFPYTSQLTITMHGNRSDPYLPVFGNKVIAVKRSTIDMHGVKRTPTWTVLNETASPGATQIKLSGAVDWVAGEQIAIAATSYNGREGEKRTIKSIDKSNPDVPVVTLDQPLEFKHFAMIQHYGNDFIDMRAEVGLLTRNVKVRGDPETTRTNQYGATIFFHSEGDDSLIARLEYIELTEVGQAFLVGRYAVHFHMIGALHKSYCKGFGTHTSFNRAFTLHGSHYLRLLENVAYEVMGHTIFIEDAVEKKNHIQGNLVMKTKRSWSLLNTDQTPACFWITNPDNNFVENHCGGSDRYGYWYDLQKHAIGPHANTNVCPENERVGEFRDNHAHSCGRYGLRIFHNMIPRKFPCKGVQYDPNNATDPFWKNPAITANFYRLTSWKNGRNGAIAEKVGDVRFHDFKVADNKLAGIEFSLTDAYGDNTTRINNALIIGRTNNSDAALERSRPFGIIGPRTENFRVDNVRFFNFDWNQAAALSSCSHCFHPAATDSGARTIRFSNLSFDSSVTRIANYQYPWRAIFFDEDGTLTGKGPNTWATPYYHHHNHTECEYNETYYGGVFCSSAVQVRRVAFYGAQPSGIFRGMGFKILRYDDDIVAEYGNKTEYLKTKSHYATMFFKKAQDPSNGWAVPFVTGHKYKIHFGMTGLDFEKLTVTASERWEPTDKSIYLVHNWTDIRRAITFTEQKTNQIIPNNSIAASQNDWHFGQHVVYNETEIRETHMVINGKNYTDPYQEQTLFLKGFRCIGSCNEKIENENVTKETSIRYWANASDWPDGKVPEEGADVHIQPGWNMIFNMNPSPIYKLIRVNGNLTFDNTTDTHLKCKHLFIRAGELHIGSAEYPMEKNARITLYGEKQMETIVYDNAIEAGNKLIANVNILRIYGKKRGWKMTRLHNPALKGSNTFDVEPGLDMVAGDRLGLLPTSYDPDTVDDVFVESYDSSTGKVTINSTLNYYHWGQQTSTGFNHDGLDMRGEVMLLTRNVKIDAEDIESWGGQIVTSDTVEIYGAEVIQRKGSTIIDSVEIFNCSQIDTFKAALRFESAASLHSSITNSAIHNGYAWGLRVKASANIHIKNNIFFNFRPIGVGVVASRNITFDNNIVGGIIDRTTLETGDKIVDLAGAVSICAYKEPDIACQNIWMRNNIVGGSVYGGFVTVGHDCGDTSGRFSGNVAHSIRGIKSGQGLFFKNSPSQSECVEFSDFKAYKCYYQGAFAYPNSKRVIMSRMTMVDNRQGAGASIQRKGDEYDTSYVAITLNDMKIYGEYGSPDCPQDRQGGFCHSVSKFGLLSSVGTWSGKPLHIGGMSALPPFKIKSIQSWLTRVEFHRTHFIGFKGKTAQGKRQRAFELNPYASDNIPIQEFFDTTFDGIGDDSLGYMFDPPKGWANIADCGNFPCTAPKNTLYTFKRNTFTGIRPSYAAENFQMIPDTPYFSEFVPNCNRWADMNVWTCNTDELGQLLFESQDPDTMDRSMQPIYSRLDGTGMNNKVNSFMDHVWDGFYTGQTRLSRFPIIVYVPKGAVYEIVYTGTPAKKMKYTLNSQDKSIGMTVRIAYPSAQSRQILKNGKRVDMNQWDEIEKMYGSIKQSFCGENRYIGVKNILEFYLTVGCTLEIAPRDAIQTMVRMEWTMNEFFANGGTTKFVDRVAGSLGIHASTIKVVSVYEGSVVLNYDILADDSDRNPEQTLAKISKQQTEQFATGKMDLGAPVLDVQASVTKATDTNSASSAAPTVSIISGGVVTAPGYDPIVISNTGSGNQEAEGGVFIPDIPIMQVNSTTVTSIDEVVEREEVIQQINKYEQQTIVTIDDRDITIFKSSDQSAIIIIVVALCALFLIVLILAIRYMYNKARQEQATAEQIKNAHKNFNQDQTIRVVPNNKVGSNFATIMQAPDKDSFDTDKKEIQVYDKDQVIIEEQYDPNQEFRIFGIGDETKGGIQSMQEKMNLADEQEDDDSSSSSNSDDQDNSVVRESNMTVSKLMAQREEALMAPNPQSQNGSRSQGSHFPSTPDSKQYGMCPSQAVSSQGNESSEQKILAEELPEDKEVVDAEDE